MKDFIRRAMDRVRAEVFPRIAYRMVLQRPIDPGALDYWRELLAGDAGQGVVLVNSLFNSEEYRLLLSNSSLGDQLLMNGMHAARCQLVRSLPPAETIVDLGGGAPNQPWGALMLMGYPHHFKKLLIVDLPINESYEQSFAKETYAVLDTPQGPVEYVYQDLARLGELGIQPGSVDLVWMGQSVEHISEEAFGELLPVIRNILKPGGYLCLDTPNRRITSIQVPDRFIHPDHKIEYFFDDLVSKIRAGGYSIEETLGIGLADDALHTGRYEAARLIGKAGLNDRPDESYIFFIKARKI